MNPAVVGYPSLVRTLGEPLSSISDSPVRDHEWLCGCYAARVHADDWLVQWCNDHDEFAIAQDGDR